MPKYLLLFGDCKWDNRMKVSALRNYSPDDFLLCFESDNSFSYVNSFIDDCYFTALDDGEGANASAYSTKSDKYDIAVGRFPVKTADEAKIMVDKSISYMENKMAGAWQNVLSSSVTTEQQRSRNVGGQHRQGCGATRSGNTGKACVLGHVYKGIVGNGKHIP